MLLTVMLRNCIILGSGRSGTSTAAECLSSSGYFMGHALLPPRVSNPTGVFEDFTVRSINEEILSPLVLPRRANVAEDRALPEQWQRWLARIPTETPVPSSSRIDTAIGNLVSNEPYCFKDPRFSYSLPAWRPHLKGAVFICMFRDPASCATSIVKFTQEFEPMRSLDISFDGALEAWSLLNRHIIEIHRLQGEWLFLHLDQLIFGNGLDRLHEFTGAKVDHSVPKAERRRNLSNLEVSQGAASVYRKLCELAEYVPT
jgi:hypothetical protein